MSDLMQDNVIRFHVSSFWKDMTCPKHQDDGTLQCCSCSRRCPQGEQWVEELDGRIVCLDCLSTIVRDTADAQPLYNQVTRGLHACLADQTAVVFCQCVHSCLIPLYSHDHTQCLHNIDRHAQSARCMRIESLAAAQCCTKVSSTSLHIIHKPQSKQKNRMHLVYVGAHC